VGVDDNGDGDDLGGVIEEKKKGYDCHN